MRQPRPRVRQTVRQTRRGGVPQTMRGAALVLAMTALVLGGCAHKTGTPNTPAFADGTLLSQVYPIGQRATPGPVKGELLDGVSFDLVSLRGQVVVVNWWGSWCSPCRVEAKHLVAAYQGSRDLNVAFLGVDVRDGRDAATAFAEDFHIPYPSLFDPAGRVALQFAAVNPNVVPTTVVLDRSGRIAAVFRKALVGGELDPVILQIATENGEPIPSAHATPASTPTPDTSASSGGAR